MKNYNNIFFSYFDATLASDNPLHFRKNLSESIQKLIMVRRDEKLQ